MSTLNRLLSGCLCWVMTTPALAQNCRAESEIPSTTPSADFDDYGDGTVSHKPTGLMWAKCPLGQSGPDCATGSAEALTWREALEAARDSTLAGYTDWRLPNIKELRTLVEERCYAPAINLSVFPAASGAGLNYWSSSPHDFSAWLVGSETGDVFDAGSVYEGGGRGSRQSVRLVRSEQ